MSQSFLNLQRFLNYFGHHSGHVGIHLDPEKYLMDTSLNMGFNSNAGWRLLFLSFTKDRSTRQMVREIVYPEGHMKQ